MSKVKFKLIFQIALHFSVKRSKLEFRSLSKKKFKNVHTDMLEKLTLIAFGDKLMRAQGVPDLFQDYRISRQLHT